MLRLRRTICSILILALVTLDLQPVVAFGLETAFAAQGSKGDASLSNKQNDSDEQNPLPPFPQDEEQQFFDWSLLNWDEEIVLPKDQEEYARRMHELTEQGRNDELAKLLLKKEKRGSDYIMNYYGVPASVQVGNSVRSH